MDKPTASISVKAINSTHQRTLNSFLKWDATYNQIVDETDDNGGRVQERAYDKACEAFKRLPGREKINLSRHVDISGY